MRLWITVLALTTATAGAAAEIAGSGATTAQTARYADERWAALEDVDELLTVGKYEAAVERLEELVAEDPDDIEAAWRLGKAYVDIGEVEAEVGSEDETRDYYRRGVDQLRAARALDPEHPDVNFNLAIAIGRHSLMGGNGDKVRGSREVKELALKTIEIDPDHDGAYHLLGRWHREVASLGFFTKALVRVVYGGFPDASYEQALEHFRRAYAIEPRMAHRLEIGIVLDEMGREDEARAVFEEVLEMESDHVDAWLMRAEAQRRLSS
ncbi:MAG TPA: tetratricopeptide repeat protein [Candidatus Krumholzibacteria bacterium]|nr:tetratricopeptide repeat protein [Candidatus Krumholzibacteria bacterium]